MCSVILIFIVASFRVVQKDIFLRCDTVQIGKDHNPNTACRVHLDPSCCLLSTRRVWASPAVLTLCLCFPGFSLSSVEEDGVRRLYVNSVKETGLASKKGKLLTILS